MKKDNQKKIYKLFGFSFLEFEIGANQFSIKFCIKIWVTVDSALTL